MNTKPYILVKIGGKAASDESAFSSLCEEISSFKDMYSFIMVHGGGAEVTRVSEVFGYKAGFRDGIRMTTPEEMEIVDMVLAGKVNKQLVRKLNTRVNAVGLSGSDGNLFFGESLEKDTPGGTRTGKIIEVNPELLNILVANEYVPVIASTSMDRNGGALNINADEAAFHIAGAIPVTHLLFLSDIPGILKDGKVVQTLNETQAQSYIADGTITEGMIPKVRSSLYALHKGVKDIIIGQYSAKGDLESLLKGKAGTAILPIQP